MPFIRHDSKLRLAWGVALIPINLVFGVSLSYCLLWDAKEHGLFYWLFIAYMVVDLLLDFATTRKHRFTLLTDWKSIAKHYGKRWFVVDLCAAIPFEYIADVTGSTHWGMWALRMLPLLKTFKVFTVLKDMQDHLHVNPAIMRLMSFGYWSAQAVHAMAIGWVLVGGAPLEMETSAAKYQLVLKEGVLQEEKSEAEVRKFTNFEVYLRSLYWTVTTVATVGYGDYSPAKDSNSQIVYGIIVEILGVSMYGYIVGNVSGLIANMDAARAAFNKRTEEVNDFMRIKRIPPALQNRVRDYYNYLWETRHNVEEGHVLAGLPHSLSVDLLIHLNQDILRKVDFFKKADEIFIREVVNMIEPEVFLPGDYIIRQGEHGDCMYFLSNGSAEVVVGGNVVARLGAGSPFGEMALVSGDKRTASIRSTDYCDVYKLNKESFDRLRDTYSEFDAQVKEVMRLRAEANKKA